MSEQRFFRFLQERIGLDVESVGASMVERALRQRCAASAAGDLDHYWLCLQQSTVEQQALIEAVIVPETWFFRYPESFTALATLARKRLAELAGARPLRLLSLPCSTGEEPYSISMALLDAGFAPCAFRVDAMDISPSSIARAELAVYGRNSFRGSDLAFRDRHFEGVNDSYQLSERVRRQVSLEAANVLDPGLRARSGLYDIVFCRNLLIYFDIPTQQRVFEVLKRLLHDDGVLFIGPAEGSLLARLGMRPVGIAQSFAYVRQDPASVTAPPSPAPVVRVAATPAPPPRATAWAPNALQATRTPPAPIRPLPEPAASESEPELLASIARLANSGASDQARASCERYLRQFAPKAQVYYWLGLLSDTQGDAGEALKHYRKALYLEPQHAEALMHLAALLASQGDSAGARRLQARAAKADRESER
ncbi:CheR family methyltransferase [Pseudomonas sp. REB1044]|uniref:CheR family methyltransferase n=1 Tax=Pseudomonas sp. REB1044 TaxID=2675224 RepID=UPI00315D6173